MKWVAYILSLHILLSNAGPALEQFSFPLEWLCCDEDTQPVQQTQNNADHQACNPFIHCHCCVGYVNSSSQEFSWFNPPFIVHTATYKPLFSNIISPPVWHPPKG